MILNLKRRREAVFFKRGERTGRLLAYILEGANLLAVLGDSIESVSPRWSGRGRLVSHLLLQVTLVLQSLTSYTPTLADTQLREIHFTK